MAKDNATVLIVEGDPDVRLLCRTTLEFEGYEVVEARDGEQAMRRLRATPPNVVLLGVALAGPDGWEVLSAIKADDGLKDLPVVMLTAEAKEQDPLRCWSGGAADYLTAPFAPLALSQVLEDVLATSPAEEDARRRCILSRLQPREDI